MAENLGPAAATGNVLEIARAQRDGLRKSDRKVCDVVLEDPQRILAATVAETARIAGVSQPTVIRFCTSIGCDGFRDFKLRLAHSLALGVSATHSAIDDSDAPEAVARKVFDYTMTSLDWARSRLAPVALRRAVSVLADARRIHFFGLGASGIVALDAQQKFPMFGIPCGAEIDAHQQVMVATLLGPGDVAVAISNTGATRSIIDVARLARASGATVVGLTGNPGGPLARECDIVLLTETLENTNIYTPTISRIAALIVIDILSTAVALGRGEAHVGSFARMKRALGEMRVGAADQPPKDRSVP